MKLKSILSTTLVASLLLSCGRTGKNDQTDFNGNWAFHIVERKITTYGKHRTSRGERPVAGNMLVPQNLRHFKLQQREEIFHRV